MSNLSKLVNNSKKMNELLTELNASLNAEACDYVVKPEYKEAGTNFYSLLDKKSGRVMIDSITRIKSWLNVRNIDPNRVYFHQ